MKVKTNVRGGPGDGGVSTGPGGGGTGGTHGG